MNDDWDDDPAEERNRKQVEKKVANDLGQKVGNLRKAVAMSINGFGWAQIAEVCDYATPRSAQSAVERLLGETYTNSDLQSARTKARARYEKLLQGVMPDAQSPYVRDKDGKVTDERNEMHLPSVAASVKLIESIARLDGLNAPTEIKYSPGAVEFAETMGAIKQSLNADAPESGSIFDDEDIIDAEEVPVDAESAEG